jgi:hypothetical protein
MSFPLGGHIVSPTVEADGGMTDVFVRFVAADDLRSRLRVVGGGARFVRIAFILTT